MHQLRSSGLKYGEVWATGGWFAPIMNLIIPYQIMKDLYDNAEILIARNLKDYQHQLKDGYLIAWWTLWIVGGTSDRVLNNVGGGFKQC